MIELPKGLSGSGRPSAPAVEGKTGFIPKGYCVSWNKGGCSKDNCTYKHKSPSHVIEVANPAKPEVAQMNVLVLPDQRGR